MARCSSCGKPTKKIDNMYICPDGHSLHAVDELSEFTGAPGGRALKKKRVISTTGLKALSSTELHLLVGIDLFQEAIKLFGIPYSVASTYLPILYTILEQDMQKKADRIRQYTSMMFFLVYLIKRDYEETKGNVFLYFDFTRKLLSDAKLAKFIVAKTHKLSTITRKPLSWSVRVVNKLDKGLRDLQHFLPTRKELMCGIYGNLSDNVLDAVCVYFGLTKTEKLASGFVNFKDSLSLIQIEEVVNKLIFPEHLVGVYLYYYYLFGCHLTMIDNSVKIQEHVSPTTNIRTIQDFFSRETSFTGYKQLNSYLFQIETQPSDQIVLNPLEFPVESFGTAITPNLHIKLSTGIFIQLACGLGVKEQLLLDLIRITGFRYTRFITGLTRFW
ncbi:hypothetical protein NEDG_01712 [Nematocida displodere]|uniref:Uncharacterized protein n=1 Tax=Nematocida displodere TaxID=1805483 RepID=A0A177EGL0_9MICR|nr:hypothetical protein NEDG_01712 [Nematocida displodere]